MPTRRSVYDDDGDVTYLYHYTNPTGHRGIMRDQLIRTTEAGSKFAWFGQGVYMTALPPSVGRSRLLYNNHHKTHTMDPNLRAKTSVYFKFERRHLPRARKMRDRYERDVWVYRSAIDLSVVPYETGNTDEYKEEEEEEEVREVSPVPTVVRRQPTYNYQPSTPRLSTYSSAGVYSYQPEESSSPSPLAPRRHIGPIGAARRQAANDECPNCTIL